jgi:hypothetical protein
VAREVNIPMVISPNSTSGRGLARETTWLYLWLFAVNLQVVLLNLLIIINVLKAKSFQKSSSAKYFVLSLSISDLIVGLIVMPFGIISLVSNTWHFGGWWCELWQTFDFFACTASILNLCTVSIDRSVCRPCLSLNSLVLELPCRLLVLLGSRADTSPSVVRSCTPVG